MLPRIAHVFSQKFLASTAVVTQPAPDIRKARQFFDSVAKRLNINQVEEWYSIPQTRIAAIAGGEGVLAGFNRSLPHALQACYSEHKWEPWRFPRAPRNFYSVEENRRAVFNSISSELQIRSPPDWYSISQVQFNRAGGRQLLKYAKDAESLPSLLATLMPEHKWHPWLFRGTKNGYWGDRATHRPYLEWLAIELKIGSDFQRWYQVEAKAVRANHGSALLSHHYGGNVGKMITTNFPEYPWDANRFQRAIT